jgi:uncharacterized protein
MPSLNQNITGPIYVADQREQDYLLVNRKSGAWAVSDFAGVLALRIGAETAAAELPSPLRLLLKSSVATPPASQVEPLIIVYKLTDNCDYRCSYCYDRVVARPRKSGRRSAAVRELLDRTLPERPVMLLFHGGEPLLEFAELRDLVLAYERFTPDHLLFALQTNLNRLVQSKLDFLQEHRFGICVSVDGHNSELNRLRTSGARPDPYQLLGDKIRSLRGLRADRLGLLMTVGRHNVNELTDSILAFQDDGFKSVSFSFMQNMGPSAHCASPEELITSLVSVTRAIVDKKIDALACMTLIQWVMRIANGRSGFVCLGSPCGAGHSVVTVLADGDIGPCDSVYSSGFFHSDVGRYMRGLENDSRLMALRSRSVHNLRPCSVCDVRPHCNGTCPGAAVLEYGDIESVDPHQCAFHYGLIRELLWILCEPEAGPRLIHYCKRHLYEKKTHGF